MTHDPTQDHREEGTTMDDSSQHPTAAPEQPTTKRTWRDRLPSGRRAVATGAVVAGLAIGGAGFGAGYAVGDDGTTGTTQTGDGDWGDRGLPGDHGPMGGTGSELGGGGEGQAPDFDGDGQPDTDNGSATQNS
jgi:hypothetical protein